MRIVVFNDPHFSDRPPVSRRATYRQAILDKLQEIVSFANDYKAEVLACSGDWFISKRPEATSHALQAEIYQRLHEFGGTLVTAIGNHDCENLPHFAKSPLYMITQAAEVSFDLKS